MRSRISLVALLGVLAGVLLAGAPVEAQGGRGGRGGGAGPQDTTGAGGAPSLRAMMQRAALDSDLRVAVRRYEQDLNVLRQRYDVPLSPVRIARERAFHDGWLRQLESVNPAELNASGREERTVLGRTIMAAQVELDAQERQVREMAPLLPFVRRLQMLQEQRRDRLDVEPQAAAQTVEDARREVLRLTAAVPGARSGGAPEFRDITPEIAERATDYMGTLRSVLENWYDYYNGFDPLFTWWVRKPYEELEEAFDVYVGAIRREWPR